MAAGERPPIGPSPGVPPHGGAPAADQPYDPEGPTIDEEYYEEWQAGPQEREADAPAEDGGQADMPWVDLMMELSIPPDEVMKRLSAAVEDDKLSLRELLRHEEKGFAGRRSREGFVLYVTEGVASKNAFSLVCEALVEPDEAGSCLVARFHMRSLARVFLIIWTLFVGALVAYEVITAWPHMPGFRLVMGTTGLSGFVIGLFILGKVFGTSQQMQMRSLMRELFKDVTVSVEEFNLPS